MSGTSGFSTRFKHNVYFGWQWANCGRKPLVLVEMWYTPYVSASVSAERFRYRLEKARPKNFTNWRGLVREAFADQFLRVGRKYCIVKFQLNCSLRSYHNRPDRMTSG